MAVSTELVEVCSRCSRKHLTHWGTPACSAHRKHTNGEPCTQARMYGLQVCYHHGGATRRSRTAAKRRVAMNEVIQSLGVEREIDPAEALLKAVYLAAGDVEFLQGQLPENYLALRFQLGTEDANRVSALSDGVDVRVKLYHEALDRQVRYSKLALDAGIAERQVRLKEAEAATIVTLMVTLLDDPGLGLTAAQRALGRQRARTLLLEQSATSRRSLGIVQEPDGKPGTALSGVLLDRDSHERTG